MRKISAHWVFPVSSAPIKNGIIELDDHGTITAIHQPDGNFREIAGLEFYQGIICPGFVNAHCHLELSHMKGLLEENLGLPEFVKSVNSLRSFDQDTIYLAMRQGNKFMERSGIVAVGDISNTELSVNIKQKSAINYYTFIECFGFLPERADGAIANWAPVHRSFLEKGLKSSLSPHAPYSVSDQLFEAIHAENAPQSRISIHHLEHRSEDELYRSKHGAMYNHLTQNHGFDLSDWHPIHESATDFILNNTPTDSPLLLVHNTYVDEVTIEKLKNNRSVDNTYLICCPRSNRYIDSVLPNIPLLMESGFPVGLGTDSLASNHSLSILDEMKCISEAFESITLDQMIAMATIQGAKALDLDDRLGTLEVGKASGINLITGIDMKSMKLLPEASVKKLA